MSVPRLAAILCVLFSAVIALGQPGPPADVDAKLPADVAAARDSLKDHPKFKKFYDHLAANPDTLPVNGPKLAALLAAEAKTSAAIKDHAPSLLATWQEVVRLAAAGNDYKTALPAIDSLQNHRSGILTAAAARKAKGKILAAVAEVSTKPAPGERETLLELVRDLLKESLTANDVEALPSLLAADAKLSWSTAESANSIQLLLPLAQQAIDGNRAAAAKLLFDHLDLLIPKTAAGKSRKEFTDALTMARERLSTVESAQQAQQTLAAKPLDPAANQAYGNYLLACGQARQSLTYLALGTDAEWKKLAAESLEAKTAPEKIALADRWTAIDAKSGKQLARGLYEEALADKSLVGIPRAAAEEKLKSLGPAPLPLTPAVRPATVATDRKTLPLNEWTELLPLIDFDQDLERGRFSQGPRNSVVMYDSPNARIRLPVLLEDCSYDLAVEVKPGSPAQEVHVLLPVGKQSVGLFVDANKDNQHTFIDVSSEKNIKGNLLLPNQNYRYDIEVRLQDGRAKVSFSLNGKFLVYQERPVAEFKMREGYALRTDKQPGLAGYRSNAVFTSCQVRPISGTATIGRDVPLMKPIPASVLALKGTSLTTLRPVAASFTGDWHGVNGGTDQPPIVGGALCREYLFAHAPSSLTYAIPAKAKYFTAISYCALSRTVNFIVRIDGKEAFSVERLPIAPVFVEIPEGAKSLELICDDLGNREFDGSFWCFPAFRQ
ncbi:hypothetical protein [Anatilimnocola floriformis]|uniref:hypothetical protein n=1 Tax=Anatilimnocola floriformis TaxID=2948575 RepID=UPI0020C38A83|nr:hypothetical protein [Anatilimnocola floriformis]